MREGKKESGGEGDKEIDGEPPEAPMKLAAIIKLLRENVVALHHVVECKLISSPHSATDFLLLPSSYILSSSKIHSLNSLILKVAQIYAV